MKKRTILQDGIKLFALLFFTGSFVLNGQTLKHSYTFEEGTYDATTVYDQVGSLNATIGGEMITIAEGKATVSGATVNSDGWLSMDGVALALNAYSAVTLEAYVETGNVLNAGFTMLAYFGSSTPGSNCFWIQPTRSGNETRMEANNGSSIIASKTGYEVDDGKMHHIAGVLDANNLTYWLDGIILAQISTEGADFISTIGTDVANIFRGVDGWNDPNYNASLEEFNIYDGALDGGTILQHATDYLGILPSDARLDTLYANLGVLSPEFEASTDVYELSVPYGISTVELTAIPLVDGASVNMFDGLGNEITNGIVSFDKEEGIDVEIIVTALDGTTEMPYYVGIFPEDGESSATLADIEVSVGALNPLFNVDSTEYSLLVPTGTTSVDVNGIPNYDEATVTGNGTVTLSNGTGTAVLNVTSKDGSAAMTYTVNITEGDGKNYAISMPGGNGTDSNIDISGLNLTTLPFTVEMWIKPNGTQVAYAGLFYHRGTTNSGLYYAAGWQGTNLIRMDFGDNIVSGLVAPDQWHHVAVVVTADAKTIYVDGAVSASGTTANSDYDFTNGELYIGYDKAIIDRTFNGLIDEVRVWSDERTAQELDENRYEILTGNEDNLVAYWNFDIPNPTVAIDIAGELHGPITGGTYVESFPRVNLELDTLFIDEGNIRPDFDKAVSDYYITLPEGTTSFNISAEASNPSATISGTGTINVTGSPATTTITVSAGGESIDYTVHYVVDTQLSLTHSYTFANGTAEDMVGDADGIVMGGTITEGAYTSSADGDYIELPAKEIALNTYPSFTMEAYVTIGVNDGYAMLAYFGGLTGSNAAWMQPNRADDISRAQLGTNGSVTQANGLEFGADESHHYVFTVNGDSLVWYIDGLIYGSTQLNANSTISGISTENAWICKSGWSDPSWLGTIYEFNIYTGAMSENEVMERSFDYPIEDETTDATLSALILNGDTIAGFAPTTLHYVDTVDTAPSVDAIVKVDGATATVFQATSVPGTATILVTAADGTTQVTYTVEFVKPTAVREVTPDFMKVYPTVSNGEFTISTEGKAAVATVYNLNGKMILQKKSKADNIIIHVPDAGMYLVKVESDGAMGTFKVLKTK